MSLILQLDASGQPTNWIDWKTAVTLKSKSLVVWELGEISFEARGGTSAKTGERTIVIASSIIAVKGSASKRKYRTPALNNRSLFRRDFHLCAYCGKQFPESKLTREHIMPISRGGQDTWMNVVSACSGCNTWKGDNTPEEAGMKLLYVPYTPSRIEALILRNRNVKQDQMEFLLGFLPADSKIRKGLNLQ